MTAKVAGTFAQNAPAPGPTWHVVSFGVATVCGAAIERGADWWQTDQMQTWKVCAACLAGVDRCPECHALIGADPHRRECPTVAATAALMGGGSRRLAIARGECRHEPTADGTRCAHCGIPSVPVQADELATELWRAYHLSVDRYESDDYRVDLCAEPKR